MFNFLKLPILLLSGIFLTTGCGYTTSSSLPSNLRTVHVEAFVNEIIYVTETVRNLYFPLLELDVQNKIIDRYQFDGNLRIAEAEDADLILKGKLTSYHRGGLRYDDQDDAEEYRVQVTVSLEMWDTSRDEILWEEGGIVGEADYFVAGPNVTSEESALDEATLDLARRIVERTIEDW